jgi:hypothetical protein
MHYSTNSIIKCGLGSSRFGRAKEAIHTGVRDVFLQKEVRARSLDLVSMASHSVTHGLSPTVLFDPQMLSTKVISELPGSDYVMRPLSMGDYDKHYYSLLAQLTKVGDVSKSQFEGRLYQRSEYVL